MSVAPSSTDRIEKRFEVKAPRSRVWRAIADSGEFGAWFGIKADRAFTPGAAVRAQVTFKGHEHITLEVIVEKVEPESYFSYRWHPYPMDAARDFSREPMTLVEFSLAESSGGTTVTIVESGFDALPADRRAEAFRMNDAGWENQAKRLTAHVG